MKVDYCKVTFDTVEERDRFYSSGYNITLVETDGEMMEEW